MAFETTNALAVLAEKELGHDVSGASTQRDDIVSHMDQGHKMILNGGGILNVDKVGNQLDEDIVFNFAKSATPKVLTLRPAVTDVTVTLTRNSNALTMNAAPDGVNSIAGWFLRVQDEEELYQIYTHTAAATTAVLDGPYVGPANVTTAEAVLVQLQYTLGNADILRLVSPITTFDSDRGISIVDKDELYEQYPPSQVTQAFPRLAATIRENDGTWTIQFSSYPDDYERIEIDYIARPTELNATSNVNPILPREFRVILAHYAAYSLMPRNNDNRAAMQLKLAQDKFRALVTWDENNKTSADDNYGAVRPVGFSRPPKVGVRSPVD